MRRPIALCLSARTKHHAEPKPFEQRLLEFQDYYEQLATPFEWKFTRDDLARLIKKLTAKSDPLPLAA